MTSNQKFLAGLILGAAAGAAIALFINSDKGQEVLSEVKDTADKLGKDIKAKLEGIDDELGDLLQKGKDFVADIRNKGKEATA
ncbi:YtxH domain-containing protein [Chitinophagaceae bacterium LWZ2-11]